MQTEGESQEDQGAASSQGFTFGEVEEVLFRVVVHLVQEDTGAVEEVLAAAVEERDGLDVLLVQMLCYLDT